MKKIVLSSALTGVLLFSGFGSSAFASSNADFTNPDLLSETVLPSEVKEALKSEQQPELDEIKGKKPEEYHLTENPYKKGKKESEVVPTAATVGLNKTSYDTAYSNKWGSDGANVINVTSYLTGKWSDFIYWAFKGWGYTGYSGSKTVEDVTAQVKVSATGAFPQISSGGSAWSVLSSNKVIADGKKVTGKNYAMAEFSNTKIQALTTLTAIFENKSYLRIKGYNGETWYEDTWFWF
ncbi:hypothetical protein ABEW00_05915 [Rossellomorea vietnamensis]|jgi:hypothetical protein|uniref:hypothetical protein n=1 Tax=Rossellomorea vietnamensis TaxID=218284 RepID=UPI003D2E1D59